MKRRIESFPSKNHAIQWKVGLPKHLVPFQTTRLCCTDMGSMSLRENLASDSSENPEESLCEPIQSIKMTFETEALFQSDKWDGIILSDYVFLLSCGTFLKYCMGRKLGKHVISHAIMQNVSIQIRFREFGRAWNPVSIAFHCEPFQIAIIIQNQRTSYCIVLGWWIIM